MLLSTPMLSLRTYRPAVAVFATDWRSGEEFWGTREAGFVAASSFSRFETTA